MWLRLWIVTKIIDGQAQGVDRQGQVMVDARVELAVVLADVAEVVHIAEVEEVVHMAEVVVLADVVELHASFCLT